MQSSQSEPLRIGSKDGALTYILEATRSGLCVERRYTADVEACTGFSSIGTIFEDFESFQEFCDSDRLRFTYPMVFKELKDRASYFFHS